VPGIWQQKNYYLINYGCFTEVKMDLDLFNNNGDETIAVPVYKHLNRNRYALSETFSCVDVITFQSLNASAHTVVLQMMNEVIAEQRCIIPAKTPGV